MEIFIKSSNYRVWSVIMNGNIRITKTSAAGVVTDKPENEYVKEDYETMEVNYSAMQMLMCALGPLEHNRIIGCKTARQIWRLLEVTHEGTNEVKTSKVDLLVR